MSEDTSHLAARQHDAIYTAQYYRRLNRSMKHAAQVVATSIVAAFCPKTLVDFGCGTGDLLHELAKRDVQGVGLELSAAALRKCCRKGLDCRRCDLSTDHIVPPLSADVAVSLEVAEHLPESSASHYLSLLCSVAPRVVFSAATPGQGGRAHLNEQPHDYWITRIESHRFTVDWTTTQRWRAEWESAGIATWYHRNVLVFETC